MFIKNFLIKLSSGGGDGDGNGEQQGDDGDGDGDGRDNLQFCFFLLFTLLGIVIN